MLHIGHITTSVHRFFKDETGAITVDWVVLTASILLFGLVFVSMVKTGQDEIGDAVGTTLTNSAQTLPEVSF